MSKSKQHNMSPIMHDIIEALMREEGRDFGVCEYKGCSILNGAYEIHHTKYDGSTYYDLMIVCRRCNRLSENLGLE